jgi:hypothetical protein
VLALGISASAAQAETLPARNRRLICDAVSSIDPHVSIRGTLQIRETPSGWGSARGSIRVSLDSPTQIARLAVRGDYFNNGSFENVVLSSMNVSDIEEIYVDFKEEPYQANSYVTTRGGGYYRMSCHGSAL